MMSRDKSVSLMLLLLASVLLFGIATCAPIPDGEYNALKAELDTAKAEVNKLRAEIAIAKTASLEELLRQRRSIRDYADAPLTQDEVMKLLWAGQGVTVAWGGRTAPSAGALYPLELYVAVGSVENLTSGVYRYDPWQNKLSLVKEGDVRNSLALASLGQSSVADAAIDIVIAAVYKRTTVKYGSKGERYVHIEVGHAAQNICLEATAMGLGLVTIGAFEDATVAKIIGTSAEEAPLYVIPVGRTE